MELKPELIETIKGHFAKKPSAELRAILAAHDTATMSEEAFAAAEAVLAARARGDATEPVSPDPPKPPKTPKPPHQPQREHALAWALVWVLRGFAILAAICGVVISLKVLASGGLGRETLLVAFQAVCAVVGPLALAEGLRLGILIEGNTRRASPPRE